MLLIFLPLADIFWMKVFLLTVSSLDLFSKPSLHTEVFEEILAIVFRYILQISFFDQNDSNTNTVNEYLVYICMEDRV